MAVIRVGLNGRFFPLNWRPALQEIAFAQANGFRCVQFPGREAGLSEAYLGAPYKDIAEALDAGRLDVIMEMVVQVGKDGRTESGRTPLDVLQRNLPAIRGLQVKYVHWHLVPMERLSQAENAELELSLVGQFTDAVAIAEREGFAFGFEHNEPYMRLFGSPGTCAEMLERVDGLRFVWDVNHTIPAHLDAFCALAPRMSVLHLSDTPLPEVNHHLPVGHGSIDFANYFRRLLEAKFSGPAVLEIGGLPKSGGYGRDTDYALIDSLKRLNRVLERG